MNISLILTPHSCNGTYTLGPGTQLKGSIYEVLYRRWIRIFALLFYMYYIASK